MMMHDCRDPFLVPLIIIIQTRSYVLYSSLNYFTREVPVDFIRSTVVDDTWRKIHGERYFVYFFFFGSLRLGLLN